RQGQAETDERRRVEGADRPGNDEPEVLRARAGRGRQPEQDELRTADRRLRLGELRLPAVNSPRRAPLWAALVALVALSTGLRAWGALDVPVPWIAPDEMIYALTGQSLYHSGSLDILGGPTPYY